MDSDLGLMACERRLVIDGERCCLVSFSSQHRDHPEYLSWLRDVEVVRTLNLPHYVETPVQLSEVVAYCDALMNSKTDLFFAILDREDDRFVGTIKAGRIDRFTGTADIGIMIGCRERWNKGLATDAVKSLTQDLFQRLELRKLTAGTMACNPAMINVFERLGFKREGLFRAQDRIGDAYFDHIHLGCFRNEFVSR
jgi:ribosomal-protein-alanine N-acetyltransferase